MRPSPPHSAGSAAGARAKARRPRGRARRTARLRQRPAGARATRCLRGAVVGGTRWPPRADVTARLLLRRRRRCATARIARSDGRGSDGVAFHCCSRARARCPALPCRARVRAACACPCAPTAAPPPLGASDFLSWTARWSGQRCVASASASAGRAPRRACRRLQAPPRLGAGASGGPPGGSRITRGARAHARAPAAAAGVSRCARHVSKRRRREARQALSRGGRAVEVAHQAEANDTRRHVYLWRAACPRTARAG